MSGNSKSIAVVDLGSKCARLLVVDDVSPPRIVAYASVGSSGIWQGVVVDLEQATNTLSSLWAQAQDKMPKNIEQVYCSISGDSIASVNSHSVVKVQQREISAYDMSELLSTAKTIALDNQQIIHITPQSFRVDNQRGVIDPEGMYGVRLEGDFHLVLADQGVTQNLMRCFSRVGIPLSGFVFTPLGLAEAVLREDEKQQGIVLVDIGAGCTDFVVYIDGALVYSASIPIGGDAVSRDLAHRLKVDNSIGERMKLAMTHVGDEQFEGGVSAKELQDVVSARYVQIFKLIDGHLIRLGLKPQVGRGFVLCGGGAKSPDLVSLVESTCLKPCRLGGLLQEDIPCYRQDWLSAVGLVYYIRQQSMGFMGRDNSCRNAYKMLQRWLEVYF